MPQPSRQTEGEPGSHIKKIIKVLDEQTAHHSCEPRALWVPVYPKMPTDDIKEVLDASSLLDWWKNVTPWDSLCRELELKNETERNVIKLKAEHLYKAVQLYMFLLSEHVGTLREHVVDLFSISENLNKVSKGTNIAGITWGSAAVVGGLAVAAGVILSRFTKGASLALTAVGVGVATAGGVTGASAAIANTVNANNDKKKIDKTFQDYGDLMKDIQDCLKFINEGMEQLKKHDVSVLSEATTDPTRKRVGKVVQLATTGGGSAKAIEANSKASGLMKGFALSMDMYYTDGQKIYELAEGLNAALDEFVQIQDLFEKSF